MIFLLTFSLDMIYLFAAAERHAMPLCFAFVDIFIWRSSIMRAYFSSFCAIIFLSPYFIHFHFAERHFMMALHLLLHHSSSYVSSSFIVS